MLQLLVNHGTTIVLAYHRPVVTVEFRDLVFILEPSDVYCWSSLQRPSRS